jgi:hypothetical protein
VTGDVVRYVKDMGLVENVFSICFDVIGSIVMAVILGSVLF